jgi:hypothetical protein
MFNMLHSIHMCHSLPQQAMYHVDSSRLFTLINNDDDNDKADLVLSLLQDALQVLGQFKTVYLHYKARVSVLAYMA